MQDLPGFNSAAFQAVHEQQASITSIRLNPAKWQKPEGHLFPEDTGKQLVPPVTAEPVPWAANGYYLSTRPFFTFDPFLHAGAYYVQEASSMLLEQAFLQSTAGATGLRVLDLCAAPGGKSTHLESLLPENSLLVSNEVIKSRAAILCENLTKWGSDRVVVTNNDPAAFARLEGFFDVVVVDAPCSGSGLFRREPELVVEWGLPQVQLCSQRQQRILADVLPALKQEGILIYSTCSYSQAEDEAILDWLVAEFGLEPLRIAVHQEWGVTEVHTGSGAAWGYRCWPDQVKGEGFFLACFRNTSGSGRMVARSRKEKLVKAGKKDAALAASWVQAAGQGFYMQGELLFAFPEQLEPELQTLMQASLYLQQAGVTLGKPANGQLIPEHALALYPRRSTELVAITLNQVQALQYLRRDEVILADSNSPRGWVLATYEGQALGWLKQLDRRINNYYPKEWRILKSPSY